jgi:hypothetical protein
MSGRPVRASAPSAAAPLPPAPRPAGTAIEPMLPALIRGVIFLGALAMPFVAALLAR